MEAYALLFVFCPGAILLAGIVLLVAFKQDVR